MEFISNNFHFFFLFDYESIHEPLSTIPNTFESRPNIHNFNIYIYTHIQV